MLNPNRFFPADPTTRAVAAELFKSIEALPLVCPHGHTDPEWFANNAAFDDPAQLLVVPDHYIIRMLVSQGLTHGQLGRPSKDGTSFQTDGRVIWGLFAENYHLFRSTPVRQWMDYTLQTLFGIEGPLTASSADETYDTIANALKDDGLRPRALFDRFKIEVLATTDSCLGTLEHHKSVRDGAWSGRVIPTYRPDDVTNPEMHGFLSNVARLGEITGEDTTTWQGLLAAHRKRRLDFIEMGATASDHGHPSAQTADLPLADCEALFERVKSGLATTDDCELYRAQMLTEMARMSLEDGLVMQLHPGSRRNHSAHVFGRYGPDCGFDIPGPTNYVEALRPLLNAHGHDSRLRLIVFTLDETTYGQQLAPMAAAYPCLKIGPAWWFFDSLDGMMRYRETVTETAGYYNTVGFNDDTRALPSIAARHDMARRVDCAFLARQVVEHRMSEVEAAEVAKDLTYNLAMSAYKLEASQ